MANMCSQQNKSEPQFSIKLPSGTEKAGQWFPLEVLTSNILQKYKAGILKIALFLIIIHT